MAKARKLAHGSAFTLENREKIIKCATRGASRKTAAQIAGITDRSLRNWLAKGRENVYAVEDAMLSGQAAQLDDYGRFFIDFECAEGLAKDKANKCIMIEIEKGNLEAAKFLLTTKEPETYGRGSKITLAALDGEGQEVDVAAMLIDRLNTIEERSTKALGEGSEEE